MAGNKMLVSTTGVVLLTISFAFVFVTVIFTAYTALLVCIKT